MSVGAVRVLLLTHSYSPEVSPPQRRWDSFVYVMRQEGWEVSIVTPRSVAKVLGSEPVRPFSVEEIGQHGELIRTYPSIKKPRRISGKVLKNFLDGALMLPQALFQERPTVVVATVPALPTMFVGFIVSRVLRRPLIIEMRDAWPDLISDSRILKWRWLTESAHKGVRLLQRQATLVVTVTDGFAAVLLEDGVQKVRTIQNGISTRSFEPLPVGNPNSAEMLNVLYLGNLGESQGLESIIKASALTAGKVQLRIVGSGTAHDRLVRYASQIGAKVEFQDPARGEALRAHYLWADSCVVSLRDDWKSFSHTIPSKIYELLSLGKHITGVVKGEAAHIITSAGAGDIVGHDAEEIATLWKELAAQRERLDVGSSGREWVFENASLEKLGKQYVEIITCINEQGHKREPR